MSFITYNNGLEQYLNSFLSIKHLNFCASISQPLLHITTQPEPVFLSHQKDFIQISFILKPFFKKWPAMHLKSIRSLIWFMTPYLFSTFSPSHPLLLSAPTYLSSIYFCPSPHLWCFRRKEWSEISERSLTPLHELIWDERVSVTDRRCRLSRPVGRTDDNYSSCCFAVWNDWPPPSPTRCCWDAKHVVIIWKNVLEVDWRLVIFSGNVSFQYLEFTLLVSSEHAKKSNLKWCTVKTRILFYTMWHRYLQPINQ